MGKPLTSFSTNIIFSASVSTSAYTAGDQIGSGAILLQRAARENAGGSVIISVTVVDAESKSNEIDFFFFNQNPNITSTDNAALALTDADAKAACVGWINVSAADYKSYGGGTIGCAKSVGLLLKPTSGIQDCYVVPVTRSAPTFSSSNSLLYQFGLLQD